MTCCPSANLMRPCPLRVNRHEEEEPGWSAAKRQHAHTHRRGVCATRRGAAPGGWAARRWCTAASCARGRPTGWARAWWPPSGTRSRSPTRQRPPCASSSQARPRQGGAPAVRFGGSRTITVPLLGETRLVQCRLPLGGDVLQVRTAARNAPAIASVLRPAARRATQAARRRRPLAGRSDGRPRRARHRVPVRRAQRPGKRPGPFAWFRQRGIQGAYPTLCRRAAGPPFLLQTLLCTCSCRSSASRAPRATHARGSRHSMRVQPDSLRSAVRAARAPRARHAHGRRARRACASRGPQSARPHTLPYPTSIPAIRAQVYTFGAPRPGDTNFACECDHLFPDMWHIINDAVRRPRPRWGAQGARDVRRCARISSCARPCPAQDMRACGPTGSSDRLGAGCVCCFTPGQLRDCQEVHVRAPTGASPCAAAGRHPPRGQVRDPVPPARPARDCGLPRRHCGATVAARDSAAQRCAARRRGAPGIVREERRAGTAPRRLLVTAAGLRRLRL